MAARKRVARGPAQRAAAVFGVLVLALVAELGPKTASAGETPRPTVTNTKLKWQVRRTSAERSASEQAAAATAADDESAAPSANDAKHVSTKAAKQTSVPAASEAIAPTAQRAAAQMPIRRHPEKSSRSRVRDAVMQVSAYKTAPSDEKSDPLDDKSDPLKDPFEDNAAMDDTKTNPSAEELPSEDPPALRSTTDPFPEERVPDPLDDLGEMQPDAEGGVTPVPYGASCKEQTGECNRAIEELRRRDITKIVVGLVLEGENGQPAVEGRDYPCECVLGVHAVFEGRSWSRTNYSWKATGTCHKPLYFEDVQLERYGHSWNPVVQPFMSAGHFFVSVPLLPYKMGLTPPNECMYTLGYYRPGNCAPYMIDPIPFSLRAASYQALGITGFAFWFWPPATGLVVPTALQ